MGARGSRSVPVGSKLPFFAQVGVLFLAGGLGATAQSARTPDEQNTISVFRTARAGVVHISVRQQQSGEFGTTAYAEGTGSGFVIDDEGRILTNYHVIASSNRIEVYLPGGRMSVAHVVGTAPTLDLALLQIDLEPGDAIEPLRLGDSDSLEVGQKVIAVGHPLSLHNSVTVGVVSALSRSLPDSPVELRGAMVQTDAAISPGSSGGPLLDSRGEVIAIATAVASKGQNIGFAVPINLAKEVLPDLVAMGHPYRPSLGIDGREITGEIADLFRLPRREGFLVERVMPGSLADRAGLQGGGRVVLLNETAFVLGGDILTAINGKEIASAADIASVLLSSHPGEVLTLIVLRNGVFENVTIPLTPMH